MSGRIERIPIKSAIPQCRALFLVQMASPPQRIEIINENTEAKDPFHYELTVERYVYLEEWTHDQTPTTLFSNNKGPTLKPGDVFEGATATELMGLHVARRYYNEGVRKIPIYDCLDVPEIKDNKEQRLLFITGFQGDTHLFKVLGAAPLSQLDKSHFQTKN